ncbi:hypothetical protein KIN20_009001 [Parelaphostrongylus tenuis]|uniref:Uncharacterized protein n=1 Tax=Parelaphostrongylus tenuis TaxID=148309 RepID=A0AAD5M5L5_PARTN|nr:hypothetical protein KIN20_009001 [Parelaphostrongylus tenuis]
MTFKNSDKTRDFAKSRLLERNGRGKRRAFNIKPFAHEYSSKRKPIKFIDDEQVTMTISLS